MAREGRIHPGWGMMWTWKRPRLSAFGCNGRFAWANKSSHELFICASIREKIWLWLPDSSVLWALWGGSSLFQSVSAGAFHPVVKTMCVDESHSPRGDPWKTCSVKCKSFYSILAGERLNRSTLSHHQHPCVEIQQSILIVVRQGCPQHCVFPAWLPPSSLLKFIIGNLLWKRISSLHVLATQVYTFLLSDLYTTAVIKALESRARDKLLLRRSLNLNLCLTPCLALFLLELCKYLCSCIFSAHATAK